MARTPEDRGEGIRVAEVGPCGSCDPWALVTAVLPECHNALQSPLVQKNGTSPIGLWCRLLACVQAGSLHHNPIGLQHHLPFALFFCRNSAATEGTMIMAGSVSKT